jgi:hypothetical protein
MADIRDIALSKKKNENDKMEAQKLIALFSTKKNIIQNTQVHKFEITVT